MESNRNPLWTYLLAAGLISILSIMPTLAQEDTPEPISEPPPAEIVNDEGGPIQIVGEGDYTFPSFRVFYYDPYIVMSDAAGLIDRDHEFEVDDLSEVFGKITSDPFTPPFSYELSLPIAPRGEFRDIDHDGEEDTGVMVFTIDIAENMIDDPFQQERDFITGLLSSVRLSEDPREPLEIVSGKLLVYAPDDQQGFPSDFGLDGLVFTDDDPIVILPQGYTLVDLSTNPFTFDRSREVSVELFEPEEVEAKDLTDQTFTEAFDSLIDLFEREYAFTEYKDIDWDARHDEFRTRIEEAEEAGDVDKFRLAIRDFAWSIPDGHIRAPFSQGNFQRAIEGGLGMAIRELDDGRVITNFITPNGPAEEAGIELRAEILEINGEPILDAIEETIPWSSPFSTPHFRRLQQLRYVIRFPMSIGEVEVVYQNPGDEEPTTVTLPISDEFESFNFSSFNAGRTGNELPIEFEIRDDGYGYVKIFSFSDDLPLTFRLWERTLDTMQRNNVQGIIIDLRQNGGGSAYMADQLPAYFFDEELNLGYSAFYEEVLGEFYYDPERPSEFELPPDDKRYHGAVAVLIGPNCVSACESFAYNMTLQDRAAIVGQYPTGGLGGSVVPVFLPGSVVTSITNGRSLNAGGEIHIEGRGVQPTVEVPVTEETLFAEDAVLAQAIDYLEGETSVPFVNAGSVTIGETVEGELVEGQRVRYTLDVPEDVTLDFVVSDETGLLDTVLRIYVEGNDNPAVENDDAEGTLNSALLGLDVPGGLTLIVEVGTFNDAEEGSFILTVKESGQQEGEETEPDDE